MNSIQHVSTQKRPEKAKATYKWLINIIKLVVCALITVCVAKAFIELSGTYFETRVVDYQNNFDQNAVAVDLSNSIVQEFTSAGTELSYIRLYIEDKNDDSDGIAIQIFDKEMTPLAVKNVKPGNLIEKTWNTIGLDVTGLKKGEPYFVTVESADGSSGNVSVLYKDDGSLVNLKSCTEEGQQQEKKLALGIHQIAHALSLTRFVYLALKALGLMLVLGCIYYTVYKFESIFLLLQKPLKAVSPALVFASYLLLMANPMNDSDIAIQEFERVIGAGIASGIDVSRVISNFTAWLGGFAVLLLVGILFFSWLRESRTTVQQRAAFKFLDNFTVVAIVNLVLRGITYFYNETLTNSVFYYSSDCISIVFLAVVFYIILRLDSKLVFDDFVSVLLVAFSAAYPISVLINSTWDNGIKLLVVQGLLLIAMVVGILLGKPAIINKFDRNILAVCALVASLTPMILSLYIETVNVIVGRGLYITNLCGWYTCATLLLIAGGVILFVICRKKGYRILHEKKLAYPLLACGITMLAYQLPLATTYYAHIMESSSYGALIGDFLNYGTIPIVEHYGGHMLASVWEGIWYGIVNNDVVGATYSPYSTMLIPLLALLFYFVLKNIWNEDMAFWVTVLFPWYDYWSYFGLGFLIAAAMLLFVKKPSYVTATLFWLSCVWCTLYRLDLGMAFDVSCAVAIGCYIVFYKQWKLIKPLLVTLVGVILFFGAGWFALCMAKGIDPILRLLEFIKISASNQNWAYGSIGDPQKTMYALCYIIMPVVAITAWLYVVFSRKFREKVGAPVWMLLIVSGTSYFMNFSRGLVRHSVVENYLTVIIWSGYIFLAGVFACLLKRRYFLPVFTAFILVNTLFLQQENFSTLGFIDTAQMRVSPLVDSWCVIGWNGKNAPQDSRPKTYWENLLINGEKVQRITAYEPLAEYQPPLQQLVDLLLSSDETYVDFTNRSFLYCMLNKRDPLYVSQSPLQLSGEFTQEQYIAQLKQCKTTAPIIIMPGTDAEKETIFIDGIANTYRNFKVAEYIYQNYVPLCQNGEYAVWCTPERYADLAEKVAAASSAPEMPINTITYGYDRLPEEYLDEDEIAHKYDLKQLGEIWGDMDVEKASQNQVVAAVEKDDEGYHILSADTIDKTKGNFLSLQIDWPGTDAPGMTAPDDESVEAQISLGSMENGQFVEKYRYSFTVNEGTHEYLIRVSNDYYWYSDQIDEFQIENLDSNFVTNVCIRVGS